MKKSLLTLIATLVFCGTIFAQHPDTNYPGFYDPDYLFQASLYASIMIDGEAVDIETANWEMLEVAAFVNIGGEEIQRSYGMWLTDEYVLEYDELFPTLNADAIYYNEGGDAVYFKMHNHATGMDYTATYGTIWDDGTEVTVITGEDHWEGFDDPDHPLLLNFTSSSQTQTFTKDIIGYADGQDGWYFISSPVEGEVTPTAENGFLTAAYDLYSFDQAFEGQEWRNFKDTEVGGYNLVNGKGYLYASQTDTQLQFTGVPYSGDGVVELEYTEENVAWQGWNLIGNPFTVEAYLEGEYYVMNEDHNGYEPIYDGTVVPAMEAVLIQATEPGQSVTFTTDNPNSKSANLALNLSSNGAVVDRAIVSFDEGRSLPKVQLRETSTKVYIPMDNEDYAVVSAEEMGEMPVSFKAEKNGSYSLNFTAEEVSFNYLHLIDNMTGADVDLLETPSYSFNATTTDYANRFKLVFATGNATGDNFAFFSNGNFIISNEGEATLQVVDVMGRILMSENINGSASVNVNAAPGVYMLRLINGDNVKVQKVIVK